MSAGTVNQAKSTRVPMSRGGRSEKEQSRHPAGTRRDVEMAENGDRAVVHGAIFVGALSREYVRGGAA